MKNLITYLKTLWGVWGNLQSNDAICDGRLTVVRLSFDCRSKLLKYITVLALLLTVGVGQMWGTVTVTTSVSTYATANSWSDATAYSSISMDSYVTATAGGTGNNGKYYTSNKSWRFYESGTGSITISVPTGYYLQKVGITFTKGNNGTIKLNGSSSVTSGTDYSVTGTSAAFNSIGHSSGKDKGNIQVTQIKVIYYVPTVLTLDKNGGASDGSATIGYNATAYTSFTPVTRSGYECTGYWTNSSGGTKILNADGSCPSSSVSGWWSGSKWSKDAATAKLYAQWNAVASCEANPTIENASLNGSISLSSIPLSISSVGGGTDCTLAEYGFVWKASSAPSASDNKTKIGESSSATSFTGNITGSFSTDVTYYIKGYAINNGPNTTLSSTALTITPQSVTFNSNGGSSVSTAYVNNGATVSKPSDPTKTGYTFGGWYTDNGTFASAVNWSSNITSNQTYYAKWTAKTTTISFNQTSGTGGQTGTLTATYDAAMPSAPVTVPTRDGYDFGGYYDGSGGTGTQYYTNTGASARNWDKEDATYTLHAKWTVKTTTVSFNQNGGDGGQTSSLTATYGSAMPTPITKPTKDGYIFDGYYESSGGTGTKYYNANGTSATTWNKEDATWTLYAKWVDKGCTTHAGTNVTSGTTPSNQFGPVDLYYKYCTRQILYTKTDLNLGATKKGTIKSIYFDYATAVTKKGSVKIYMANTSLTALSTSNYVPFESFTEVYDGSFNSASTGYQEIELTTSFEYNGLGNLVVLIDDNSGQYELSTNFNTHTATTTTGAQIYKQNDSSNEDPSTTNWSTYTASNSRPNTKFCIQEADMVEATVNWYVNGEIAHTQTDYEGTALSDIPTPVSGDCDGVKVFKGWYSSEYTHATDAPAYVSPTVIPTGGANYYAVFATETAGSDEYEYIGDAGMLETDKTYIFVSSKATGSAYALKSSDLPANTTSGLTGTAVGVTISSGPKITTENTDLEFTCTTHAEDEIDELKIGSTSNYLRINGNGIGYGDARAYYDNTGLYGWNNNEDTWYDVYYNSTSGEFEASASASSRVYAYEKQTATYSNFSTTCCTQRNITLASSGSVTGGTFNSGGVAKACATREITLTATPSNSGYVFNGWTVTNSSTSANVTTTVLGAGHANDNPATMTMPDYNVTVTANFSAISGISVQTAPTKTIYLAGETFDPSALVVTATYANGATVDVPYSGNEALFTLSPTTATALTTENASVSITYNVQTTSQSITVYSVTLQALDENGDAIRVGGPAAPTRDGATVTKAANVDNYVYKEWVVSGATLADGANASQKIITDPTGAVTVTVRYYLPRVVKWMVNGEEWKPYTDTGSGTDGTAEVARGAQWKTLTLPTDPNPLNAEGCGDKFIGWTNAEISGQLDKDDDAAAISTLVDSNLLNSANKSGKTKTINANPYIFYAVFADYVE